jgi:ADP-heptose:LPS heptosyltransferase
MSHSASQARSEAIAIRFEGGIGDHVLALRLLPFVRRRFPGHRIIVYSDAAGGEAQLQIARMSPYVDEVRVARRKPGSPPIDRHSNLDNLLDEDRAAMRSAAHFFDAWGGNFFIDAARALGLSPLEILAARAELRPHADAVAAAEKLLQPFAGMRFIAFNMTKFGEALRPHLARMEQLLSAILQDPRIILLNIYRTSFGFEHWPPQIAAQRRAAAEQDRLMSEELNRFHPRIEPMVDLPLPLVAALLQRCSYYIGVDNGIKHMAWALDIPRTLYLPPHPMPIDYLLRWVPDVHRLLLSTCSDAELAAHVTDARAAIDAVPAA